MSNQPYNIGVHEHDQGSYGSYAQASEQLQQHPDLLLLKGQDEAIQTSHPSGAPSRWAHFKAALYKLPLLNRLRSVRRAYAEVNAFRDQSASGWQDMAAEVEKTYGKDITERAVQQLNLKGNTAPTVGLARNLFATAKHNQQQLQSHNNHLIDQFLDSPLQGHPGQVDMTGLYLDRNQPLHGHSSWVDGMNAQAACPTQPQLPAELVKALTRRLCAQHPDYSRGVLSHDTIAQAAGQALDFYLELANTTDKSPARLEGVLLRMNDKLKDPKTPLHALHPHLVFFLLSSDPSKVDSRGVVQGSPHGHLIDPGFNASELPKQNHNESMTNEQFWYNELVSSSIDPETGLAQGFIKDLNRSEFAFSDEPLGDISDPQGRRDKFLSHFKEGQENMARAVSLCMNQRAISPLIRNFGEVAYGKGKMDSHPQDTVHSLYEAWPQKDGSYIVKASYVATVNAVADGKSLTQIASEGAFAFSRTYRVSPNPQVGGEPIISVEGTQILVGI